METVRPRAARRPTPMAWGAVALWTALVSGFVVLGADLMWVVAMGDSIRQTGHIPSSVPNLVAPQVAWRSPDALALLLLSAVHDLGGGALAALNMVIVFATLVVLVLAGRRAGGSDLRLAVSVSLVVVGAASALVVVRFPVLSLVPFVTLMALLREADRGRTRALWFVPPLMVLWGNLHGAVLVGLAVVGAFVAFAGRRGAGARVVVGVLSLLSLVLTSAGTRTPEYYVAALSNEAAKRGTDLWARPDLTNPFDAALVFCVAVLLLMARRALRRWEWVVVLGLAVGTLLAARNGVWLLLFLAPVAGVARPADRAPEVGRLNRRVVAAALAYTVVVGVIVGAQLIRRQDDVRPPGEELVAGVRELAAAGVVLAVEPEAETFAAEGLRVWMANPIDAFEPEAQRDFLDFLHECEIPDVPLDLVVVQERCADAVHAQGWSVAEDRGDLVLFTPTQGLEP